MRHFHWRGVLVAVMAAVVLAGCEVNETAVKTLESIRQYPGLEWVSERTVGEDTQQLGYEITYESRNSAEAVRDYYERELASEGWQIQTITPPTGEQPWQILFAKVGWQGYLLIGQGEGGNVTMGVKPD